MARWVATPALDFRVGSYKMKMYCLFLSDIFMIKEVEVGRIHRIFARESFYTRCLAIH